MATYNGHKNYDHWNVSLWINNDEGLYNLARGYCRRGARREAAQRFVDDLQDMGITHTPDGAEYSVSAVYAAMEDM